MPEAPAAGRSGPLAIITRKVGPLPVWAYAAVLVLAYFLYRRSHPSSSTPAGTPATTDQPYVPAFDAAGAGGSGGIGDTGAGSTVNNYYYGAAAAQQAAGGGTSPAPPPAGSGPAIHWFGPSGSGVDYVHPPSTPPPTKVATGSLGVGAYVPAGVTSTPSKFAAI